MKNTTLLFIISLVGLWPLSLHAQGGNGLEQNADKLHSEYRFDQALRIYRQLAEQAADSASRARLQDKIIRSENGRNLLEFASSPVTAARQRFLRSDFFLHYPGFPEGSWVEMPRGLAPWMPENQTAALNLPPDLKQVFYSAPDESGSWNLYTSRFQDSTWSAPRLLNENITSPGNELFPFLSADGKSLYFSSNGHYGAGGYDLYVSQWDEDANDWGIPQNLGFPYSSPADDLFYYNTPDGLYTLIASDRDTPSDSVTVYVLEFENMPLKKSITEEQARLLARLEPAKEESASEDSRNRESGNRPEENGEYTRAVTRVRQLRQEISQTLKQQDASRELYNTLSNADDLSALEKKIAQLETRTLSLQDDLNAALRDLQRVEMDFLSKGIILAETEEEKTEPARRDTPPAEPFRFADNRLGRAPQLAVDKPVPVLDLSFQIRDEAFLADLQDFPLSLVYQIQLFSLANAASLKALKGLSPVFERRNGSRYVYSAGIFRSYEEALSSLNQVKKLGFTTAIITAYENGAAVPVKTAREKQKKQDQSALYQVVLAGYPDGLPEEVLKVIRDNTEKDITKAAEGGTVKFMIGPFSRQEDAQGLADRIQAVSGQAAEVNKMEKQ